MGEIITLTVQNFEEEALRSLNPFLIEIHSPNYSSCSRMSAIVETLADHYKDRVRFGRIDIDNQPLLASQLSIGGLPCILIMQNGRIYNHIGGLLPLSYYEKLLNNILLKNQEKGIHTIRHAGTRRTMSRNKRASL